MTSLHTLGPAGTNSEMSARRWFERQGVRGEVVLYPTLEDAARAAVATPGGALLAPVAYPELHTLIYTHLGELVLADSIVTPTRSMVMARRPGTSVVATVASHPAPVALVPEGLTVSLVASNSEAAAECAAGHLDACITTEAAMELQRLELVRDFGPVPMGFTVHVRAADYPVPEPSAQGRGRAAARPSVPVARYARRGSSDV